ncbi:anti-sigma factor domain-containing protein [Cohnella pontilimi]|uniref:Anti-sigma factor domain-containing protein n=1 Tax=Cohnella pontilimi TaxID=2564100 RepID=A0A4U0F8M1_9BACL|nr:anti-sigma factor domain-containing protein [Cohnella pontilimi]TJY40981.1 anti-sigma factor domain-containing protein [Cohnella pontilimi]
MNRGTVMECSGGKAVVLTPDGQFVRVRIRRDAEIGDEITWTDSQTGDDKRSFPIRRTYWMSSVAAAAAVLLLMFGLWSFRAPTVVAYVSMDINPSVELGLDSRERVRELRAVNDDALPYIEGVEYKGKPIEAVTEILARRLSESHVLNAADSEIVIASVRLKSVDVQWEQQVTAKMERVLIQVTEGTKDAAQTKRTLEIEKLYLPVEIREEAKANGISSGKMAFWLAAEKKGHTVPLSSLKQQPLKKIAADWGGLQQVLSDDGDQEKNEQDWKKLLQHQKQKQKENQKDKNKGGVNVSPSGSASPSPASSAPSGEARNENEQKDGKPHQDKQDEKKKQNEEKHNKQDEEKKAKEDERERQKEAKEREKEQKRQKSDDRKVENGKNNDDRGDGKGEKNRKPKSGDEQESDD